MNSNLNDFIEYWFCLFFDPKEKPSITVKGITVALTFLALLTPFLVVTTVING